MILVKAGYPCYITNKRMASIYSLCPQSVVSLSLRLHIALPLIHSLCQLPMPGRFGRHDRPEKKHADLTGVKEGVNG